MNHEDCLDNERLASKGIESLKKKLRITEDNMPMYVIRKGNKQLIDFRDLKPGDIIPTDDGEELSVLSPVLAIVDNELALEALGKNILILEDPFRTGYECKDCDGSGHTDKQCKSCLGTRMVKGFAGKEEGLLPCRACMVTDRLGGLQPCGFEKCDTCSGKGASLFVPEESMRRPTSGKIVAMGDEVKKLQIGDRVVYSNMIGQQISFKQKSVFRLMRYDECTMRLHGVKSEDFQKKLK